MRSTTRPARRATATKVVASVALLAGAASVAGLGTFGAFTDTTTADQEVAAGTVELGTLNRTVSERVSGLVPGDTVQRQVELTRAAGSEELGTLALTTSVSDIVAGGGAGAIMPLLTVDACSVPWTKVGDTLELTCSGTPTSTPVKNAGVVGSFDLGALVPALNSKAAASHLRLSLHLPESAGNAFQGASATVTYRFDATQRSGKAL